MQYHPDKLHIAWNKGLTKDTDERVAINSKKALEGFKRVIENGYVNPTWTKDYWTSDKRKIRSVDAINRKLGGYHRKCGYGKKGWYKGYWCDSSWELAFVIYNLEHDIPFNRNHEGFEYIYNNKQRKYYPDFILEDGSYVEIKGYYSNCTYIKHESFINKGYKLTVIDKKTIVPYLKYVIGKYGKNFIRLYEKNII